MRCTKLLLLFLIFITCCGCATSGKYVDARGVLDRSISYSEKDSPESSHELTRVTNNVVQVPQPAIVDENSSIQIHIDKNNLKNGPAGDDLAKRAEELLKRKDAMIQALHMLSGVVDAQKKVLKLYQQRDLPAFYEAKKEAAKAGRALIKQLRPLWQGDRKGYSLLEEAFDYPTFEKLQKFLSDEVAAIDAADKKIQAELAGKSRALSLEAFLESPNKGGVAIHLDGYDALKEGSIARRDRFGLNLSQEEQKVLDANVQKTQELAALLEKVRLGEATLNAALQQAQSLLLPEVSALVDEEKRLEEKLSPSALDQRAAATKKLHDAFIQALKEHGAVISNDVKKKLENDRDTLLATTLRSKNNAFLRVLSRSRDLFTSFKQDLLVQTPTPQAMVGLINKAKDTTDSLERLIAAAPDVVPNVEAQAQAAVEGLLKSAGLDGAAFLKLEETQALRNDLEGYYRDFNDAYTLLVHARDVISGIQVQPIAEMPATSVAFQVPVNDIKDTFINLETTPRLPGDTIVVKATLREGEKEIDTSVARFEVERIGHYGVLSPAVVLVKPDQLKGGDDGFRFAPALSWMHHYYPRPENTDNAAKLMRGLDPAIGIHSIFTNFRTQGDNEAVQIGLGATISFWANRLQAGTGYNLMAKSRDRGEIYYFVGSDLIGILQTVGLVKK